MYSTSLRFSVRAWDTYRQLVKDLRSKAYVTIYYIYDKKVEQMWQDQLKPTLGEIVALGEKIQTNLMDFTESCPASVFKKIVRASDPQEEPGMRPDATRASKAWP